MRVALEELNQVMNLDNLQKADTLKGLRIRLLGPRMGVTKTRSTRTDWSPMIWDLASLTL